MHAARQSCWALLCAPDAWGMEGCGPGAACQGTGLERAHFGEGGQRLVHRSRS